QAATWGIELTRMFDFAAACVPAEQLGWLACPFVKVDIVGDPKVGFFNPAGSTALMRRVAPEILASFPATDVRALVFAIGQLMLHLVELAGKASETPLGHVIMRCLAPRAQDRFQTLAQLRDALAIVGGRRRSMSPYENPQAWELVQQAIGCALLDQPQRAASLLRRAKLVAPRFEYGELEKAFGADLAKPAIDVADYEERIRHAQAARKASEAAAVARAVAADAEVPATTKRTRNWKETRPVVRRHVEAGRYGDALALYSTSILSDEDAPAILLGTAECHLLAREYGPAIDFAQQALARDPKTVQAHAVLAEARLRRREFMQALDEIQLWTAAKPEEGHAHYVAAKVLLALGRLAEARDACDRALELAPKHLPAMMLRRQIERSVRRLASQVGTSHPAPVDLPSHMRELRPLLVAGKTAEVIAKIEKPELAADDAARLLRAELLAFTEQLDAALAAYEAIGGLNAGVGRTIVLVKLGRAAEALALCDLLVREHPGAAEAHEARALALQQLGRADEADEELRRAATADRQRSQMRVQLAKR
ncbi:MAG TPA: tetratricopeptide repeat protein, partial [Kofleriaceae bacterium]|nr:tetratricopeptide repeat protein [Kofleriaceae bacterium]